MGFPSHRVFKAEYNIICYNVHAISPEMHRFCRYKYLDFELNNAQLLDSRHFISIL